MRSARRNTWSSSSPREPMEVTCASGRSQDPSTTGVLELVAVITISAGSTAVRGSATALTSAVSANASFANARYFLSAVYAKQGDFKSALAQMQAVAAISGDNAEAVVTQLAALSTGKNPFPANLLSISPAPVKQ